MLTSACGRIRMCVRLSLQTPIPSPHPPSPPPHFVHLILFWSGWGKKNCHVTRVVESPGGESAARSHQAKPCLSRSARTGNALDRWLVFSFGGKRGKSSALRVAIVSLPTAPAVFCPIRVQLLSGFRGSPLLLCAGFLAQSQKSLDL